MKIKLLSDTIVRFPKDSVIDVDASEAKRLISLGLAKDEKQKATGKKTTKK